MLATREQELRQVVVRRPAGDPNPCAPRTVLSDGEAVQGWIPVTLAANAGGGDSWARPGTWANPRGRRWRDPSFNPRDNLAGRDSSKQALGGSGIGWRAGEDWQSDGGRRR